VLPITDRQLEYSHQLEATLKDAGIRVHVDDRKEKVNAKIREAQLQKTPYMLVVGDREAQNRTVSVRNRRHGDQGVKSVDDFIAEIRRLIDEKTPVE
jgi:threonyl-tRNA synthetase